MSTESPASEGSRLEIKLATTRDEVIACEDVICKGFGRVMRLGVESEVDEQLSLKTLYCVNEEGRVIAASRLIGLDYVARSEELVREYRIAGVPDDLRARSLLSFQSAALPEQRGSEVMTLLFRGVYEFAVENGYLFLMSAIKPFLFPYFASMGFRPYERAYVSSEGGFRIPIALVNHDQDYLRACKSLFASASNFGREAPGAAAAMEWFEKCCPKGDALNVRVLTRPEHVDFDVGFMKGLSEATIRSIFRNAVVIRCERGDQLIKQNAADQVIGFIVQGSVDVKKGDRTIATLRAGEIFGEVSFLLKVPRTASLYAAEEGTRIVYISMHSVDTIKDPVEAGVFWRSLSVHLATRLQHTTELL